MLHAESWFGHPTLLVSYWRSFEDLDRYAKDLARDHRPAWAAFNRAVGNSGAVGIRFETYRVRPGDVECLYHNMQPFGLERVVGVTPRTGHRESVPGRMNSGAT
jgi:hypothetical protein